MSGDGQSQIDPALLELFQAELDTHLPVLSERLLAIEKASASDAEVAAMMRAAHSIKGAARIVGIEPAVRIAHVMEDCFLAARDGRVALSGPSVDTLLQGVDALQRICSPDASDRLDEAWVQEIHESIAAVRDGRLATAAPPPGAASSAAAPSAARPAIPPSSFPSEYRSTLCAPDLLDDLAAETFRLEVVASRSACPSGLTIDLSSVRRITAGGLALLAALTREANRGASIIIDVQGAREPVGQLLRVAGLERQLARGVAPGAA